MGDTPSTKAFLAPAKRQVISDLIATQNVIRNKFKKAYTDRIRTVKNVAQILKPVISAITKSKTDVNKPPSNSSSNTKSTAPLSSEFLSTPKASSDINKSKLSELKISPTRSFYIPPTDNAQQRDYILGNNPFPRSKKPTQSLRTQLLQSLFKKKLSYDSDIEHIGYSDKDRTLRGNESDDDEDEQNNVRGAVGGLPKTKMMKTTRKSDKNKSVEPSINPKALVGLPMTGYKTQPSIIPQPSHVNIGLNEEKNGRAAKTSSEKIGVSTRSQTSHMRKGCGLTRRRRRLTDFDFIPYNINSRIIYEPYADANELYSRLRLLVSSRAAGNTNHLQEINSLIVELHELGYIH